MKKSLKITAIVSVGLFLFLIDRFIKGIITVNQNFSFDLFFDWFRFEVMSNSGVAFGIPVAYWILMALYAIILLGLCFAAISAVLKNDLKSLSSIMFIAFGAFSNFLDRIRFGFVWDYLYLKNFSVFNIADIMITAGVAAYLALNLFKVKDKI